MVAVMMLRTEEDKERRENKSTSKIIEGIKKEGWRQSELEFGNKSVTSLLLTKIKSIA